MQNIPQQPLPEQLTEEGQPPSPGRFYGGEGRWTGDPVEARMFNDLSELLQECGRQQITACRAVELNISGRLGLMLEKLR